MTSGRPLRETTLPYLQRMRGLSNGQSVEPLLPPLFTHLSNREFLVAWRLIFGDSRKIAFEPGSIWSGRGKNVCAESRSNLSMKTFSLHENMLTRLDGI